MELYYGEKLIVSISTKKPIYSLAGVYGVISELVKIVESILAVSLGNVCAIAHPNHPIPP